ncbi:MAG: MbcA/ParS/Xre antitoxin family protein [Gammaproteobacteria bacterium]
MISTHPVSHTQLSDREDRLSAAALLNFFGITDEWGLTTREQMVLLGNPAKTTFYRMKDFCDGKTAKPVRLSQDTLERISYIMGIYKAINILLPNNRRAAEWIKAPNTAPLFGGHSALDKMMQGRVSDLCDVRRYLDAERGH